MCILYLHLIHIGTTLKRKNKKNGVIPVPVTIAMVRAIAVLCKVNKQLILSLFVHNVSHLTQTAFQIARINIHFLKNTYIPNYHT